MPRYDTPLSPKMAALLILAVVADGKKVEGNHSPTWRALAARKLAEDYWAEDKTLKGGKRLAWRLTDAGKKLGARLTVECAE